MINNVIPAESVISKILLIRDQKVMLDSDLAKLYGVETKKLNQQVKRNIKRFPPDFMFQINEEEFNSLRSSAAVDDLKGKGWEKILALRVYRTWRRYALFGIK